MGYTHYWSCDALNKDEWNTLKKNIFNILHETDIPFELIVYENLLTINGIGDDSLETLVLENNSSDFSFCKTGRKPYDFIVCKILILAYQTGKYKIKSDGFNENGAPDLGWLEAAEGMEGPFPWEK